MADQGQGTGPVFEKVLQDPQRVQVEVVGRLVQEQHIGSAGDHYEQLKPPSFPPRKVAHPGEGEVVGEQEPTHQVDVVHRARRPVRTSDDVPDSRLQVESAPSGRSNRRLPSAQPRSSRWWA